MVGETEDASMSVDLSALENMAAEAVRLFWRSREGARRKQSDSGRLDQGERAGVTAGKNMDGFSMLMQDLVRRHGSPSARVEERGRLQVLPGYFRPTKLWDMLVFDGDELLVALEFKSHVGPSFGNNFNNRAEEAIGTACDLWTAYREGALGEQPPPFVGWLMLVEDCAASQRPVRDKCPHFPVDRAFREASYISRYDVLCRRLITEKLYSAACLMTSSRAAAECGTYGSLSSMTALPGFAAQLAGHLLARRAHRATTSSP